MRFLIISRQFPPPVTDGMSRYAENLVNGLVAQGHEVFVLCGISENKNEHLIEQKRGEVHLYMHPIVENLKYKPKPLKRFARLVESIVSKHKINKIIIQHPYHAAGSFQVRDRLRISVYYICHTASLIEAEDRKLEPEFFHDPVNEELEMMAFQKADSVICVSETLRKKLYSLYHLKHKRTYSIPTGITFYPPISSPILLKLKKKLSSNHKMILFIGRESWEKGTDLLPRIIEQTLAITKIPLFVLIGINRRNWASYLLSNQTVLLPWLNDNELSFLYSIGHSLLLPSRRDSMPYVLLESMGRGLVPIVTDNDGPGELIVDGINGLKVPIRKKTGRLYIDTQAFAERINSIVTNEVLYSQLSSNARQTVLEKHSLDNQIQQLLRILHSCNNCTF